MAKFRAPQELALSRWQNDISVDEEACDKQIGCPLLQSTWTEAIGQSVLVPFVTRF